MQPQDGSSAPAVSADDEAAIRDCVQRLTTAMDKGDREVLRQIVAEDCTMGDMGRFWDLMTPEVLESSASLGMVSKLDSVEIVAVSGGTVKVKATVTGTNPDGWSKDISDYALRKDGGAWRVAAFEGVDGEAGTGEPSKLTAADRPADGSLFTHVTPYPGVTFEPAQPSTMLLLVGMRKDLAICVAGVTQDKVEKVRDFYKKDLETHGWGDVSVATGSRRRSDGSKEASQHVSGTRPGPGGAYKLVIRIAIEDAPGGPRIAIGMGPSDSGEGSISSRETAVTWMPDKPGADAVVAPERMGEFISPYTGVQFELVDADAAPIPFVSSELATCVAGTTADSVDAVAAFYLAELQNRGWQGIRTGSETMELPGVGWVGTSSLSAKLPLPGADYELRSQITVYPHGQGSGIIICIGPS